MKNGKKVGDWTDLAIDFKDEQCLTRIAAVQRQERESNRDWKVPKEGV